MERSNLRLEVLNLFALVFILRCLSGLGHGVLVLLLVASIAEFKESLHSAHFSHSL